MTESAPATDLGDIARLGWHGFKTAHGPDAYKRIDAIGDFFDRNVVEEVGTVSRTDSAKDRLFEVLMARFDQLQAHRAAVISISNAAQRDPRLMSLFLCALPKSMRHMLDCAGLRATGVEGQVKARVLALLWLQAARHWIKDDSPDMERTMAKLDEELSKLEPIGRRFFSHDEDVIS